MMDYHNIIDRFYPVGSLRRDIYMCHCRSVADEALLILSQCALPLDADEVEAAAMLHDIGIFLTDAPSIGCHGDMPYIMHGVAGAELLRSEGVDEKYARVAELHTGSGLTAEEIIAQRLPLPHKDFLPETLLEKLICYADKFYSKGGSMKRKSPEQVRKGMRAFGEGSAARFEALNAMFGSCASH